MCPSEFFLWFWPCYCREMHFNLSEQAPPSGFHIRCNYLYIPQQHPRADGNPTVSWLGFTRCSASPPAPPGAPQPGVSARGQRPGSAPRVAPASASRGKEELGLCEVLSTWGGGSAAWSSARTWLWAWGCDLAAATLPWALTWLFWFRCVGDQQRSFALGIQWIVVRTLGIYCAV